jgi:hypothetical protein
VEKGDFFPGESSLPACLIEKSTAKQDYVHPFIVGFQAKPGYQKRYNPANS